MDKPSHMKTVDKPSHIKGGRGLKKYPTVVEKMSYPTVSSQQQEREVAPHMLHTAEKKRGPQPTQQTHHSIWEEGPHPTQQMRREGRASHKGGPHHTNPQQNLEEATARRVFTSKRRRSKSQTGLQQL